MKNRVQSLRLEKKLSQIDLSRDLGISRQSLSAVETGKYYPSLPLAFTIARYFKLPLEDIFEIDGGQNA